MRITRLSALSLVGAGLISTSVALANGTPEEGQTFVTGGYGWYDFDHEHDVHSDGGLSLSIGHRFNNAWGLEATFNSLESEQARTLADNDVDVQLIQITALRFLDAPEGWQPYLGFGIDRIDIDGVNGDDEDDAQVHAGVGVFRSLTDGWALRADARGLYGFDSEVLDALYTIGISYAWGGGSKPAPAPQPAPAPAPAPAPEGPKDSDGDGVTDDKDQCPDTAAGALVDEVGCYRTLTETVTIDLLLEFDYDKANIRPEHESEIQKVVDFMRQYPQVSAVLEGHTDSRGSTAYNQRLSEQRANAVRDYLVSQKGISADRLTAVGYGESRLKDPGNSEEAHQSNRRVAAVFAGGTQTRTVPVQQ